MYELQERTTPAQLRLDALTNMHQDPGHFPFSIRHNITMQLDRVPDEDEAIAEALRLAGLWEVVQSLPDGVDTVVGAGFGGLQVYRAGNGSGWLWGG